MWINNKQRPSVSHTFVLTHMHTHTRTSVHTHTHTPAFPNSAPPNCSSSSALQNIPHMPQIQKTDLFGISLIWGKGHCGIRLSLNIHFILYFFKCHEDGGVWIWQCTWINNICHPPSFSAWPPLSSWIVSSLCQGSPPSVRRTVAPNPCWNLITTALFNWNGIDEGGQEGDNRACSIWSPSLSFLSHSLSHFFYPCKAQMVFIYFFFFLSMSAPASFCSDE